MSRQSKIKRLAPDVRAYIEKLMRDDNKTLDEMIDAIKSKFPSDTPSRSSLGRYKQSFEEMAGRMRDIQAASQALVSELGEDVDDRAGALLAQAVTTLACNVAMDANDPDAKVSIKDVGELARAARAVMQARTMSIKERQVIEQAARDRLIAEQKEKLEQLGQTGEVSQEVLAKVIKAAYGLDV